MSAKNRKFDFWTFPNRIDQKRFESKSLTLSRSFCRFYRLSAHFGPKWRSRGPGRGLNLLEFVEKSLGISEPIIESIKIVFNPNHWPWAAIMDDFTDFGPFCGPKGRSKGLGRGLNLSEFPEKSLGMYEPLIESNKFIFIFNANHLPLVVIFNGKYWYLANFGPEIKAQGGD